jgi:hypothetical protein
MAADIYRANSAASAECYNSVQICRAKGAASPIPTRRTKKVLASGPGSGQRRMVACGTGALGARPFELRTRAAPGCSDGVSDNIYPWPLRSWSMTSGGRAAPNLNEAKQPVPLASGQAARRP